MTILNYELEITWEEMVAACLRLSHSGSREDHDTPVIVACPCPRSEL